MQVHTSYVILSNWFHMIYQSIITNFGIESNQSNQLKDEEFVSNRNCSIQEIKIINRIVLNNFVRIEIVTKQVDWLDQVDAPN